MWTFPQLEGLSSVIPKDIRWVAWETWGLSRTRGYSGGTPGSSSAGVSLVGGGWGVVRREAQIIAPTYKSETLRNLGGSFEVGGLQSGWLSKHWGKVTRDFAGDHLGR